MSCRSLASALSVPSTVGSMMERQAIALRYRTLVEKSPVKPKSRSGHPWRSTVSSWCGTMLKEESQVGSLKRLKGLRMVAGYTVDTPPTLLMHTLRLGYSNSMCVCMYALHMQIYVCMHVCAYINQSLLC